MNGKHGGSVMMSTLVECCGSCLGLLLSSHALAVSGFLSTFRSKLECPEVFIPIDVTLNQEGRING